MSVWRGRLSVCDLGMVDYGEALALQRAVRDRRIEGSVGDTLLLLEHPPTITLGRRTAAGDLHVDREGLRRLGFAVAEVERGGRATYHGPGQVVGYAIVSLKERGLSVPSFVALLEQTGIDYLAELGIEAGRRDGFNGVWTHGRKIGAIGVHLRRWVSLHGFALNRRSRPAALRRHCSLRHHRRRGDFGPPRARLRAADERGKARRRGRLFARLRLHGRGLGRHRDVAGATGRLERHLRPPLNEAAGDEEAGDDDAD